MLNLLEAESLVLVKKFCNLWIVLLLLQNFINFGKPLFIILIGNLYCWCNEISSVENHFHQLFYGNRFDVRFPHQLGEKKYWTAFTYAICYLNVTKIFRFFNKFWRWKKSYFTTMWITRDLRSSEPPNLVFIQMLLRCWKVTTSVNKSNNPPITLSAHTPHSPGSDLCLFTPFFSRSLVASFVE